MDPDSIGRICRGSREQASQGSAQQNDVISRVNRARKGRFVGIEIAKHAREQCLGRRGSGIDWGLGVAVELEQLGE